MSKLRDLRHQLLICHDDSCPRLLQALVYRALPLLKRFQSTRFAVHHVL